jgi:hypothetical protein
LGDDGVLREWDVADGTLLATRQIIESALDAERNPVSPVVLTDTGVAVVGGSTYDVCDQCLNPSALLAAANSRLKSIAPVTARS